MDLIGQLTDLWREMILDAGFGIKAYVARVGVGIAVALLMAIYLVRRPGVEEEPTRMRQVVVAVALALVVMLFPVDWIERSEPGVEVGFITACLFSALAFPHFLASSLVRTYGRQVRTRQVLYGLIGLGFLLQLAVSGGN